MDFAAARQAMVESQLMTSGVTDRRLLAAMASIPRERFVPDARKPIAYIDDEHLVTAGPRPRFLPAPAPFARLAELARIGPDDVVLDIACLTGYSTAVMATLAGAVVALEESEELAAIANDNLVDLDIGNAAVVAGPLTGGIPSEAPFDVIFIGGSVEFIPPGLLSQLREGGRLVALIGEGSTAVANLYVRAGEAERPYPSFNASMPKLAAFTCGKPEFVL